MDAVGRLKLAKLKMDQNGFAEAIEDFDKAISLKLDHPQLVEATFKRGSAKQSIRDYDGAIADFDEVIRISSDPNIEAAAYSFRGSAKASIGDHQGAHTDCNEALSMQPDNTSLILSRADVRIKCEDYSGAIEDLNEWILRKKFVRAIAVVADIKQHIELPPLYIDAHEKRAFAKRKIKDFEGAVSDYDEIIRMKPERAITYFQRGIVNAECGATTQASKDLYYSAKLNPSLTSLVTEALLDIGAIADYSDVNTQLPKDIIECGRKAYEKRKLGKFELAVADYDEIIRMKPKTGISYYQRGTTRAELGDLFGARNDLNFCAQLDPSLTALAREALLQHGINE